MIVACSKKDEPRIFSYIGSDYPDCLYLYLNLKQYGADSKSIEVFLQEEQGQITAVFLKYYSCLHIYARDSRFRTEEVMALIARLEPSMLYCAAEAAARIFDAMPEGMKRNARLTNGWVARIRTIDRLPVNHVTRARDQDYAQIVRMIYEDEDIGRSYQYEELARQLKERNQDGYARNLVIRQGNTVVAHACTNAEQGDIAVVAELIVRGEFRRRGYASDIWRALCGQLLAEGKEVYSFYYSEDSRALHRRVGFFEVCDWTKIVLKLD